jgi:ribonuclease D
MTYKKSITKDEINDLPMLKFNGKIEVITEIDKALLAIEKLANEKELGFDTETRPSFKKGERYEISLLQLSTKDCAYLFRLHKFKFPKQLADILSNQEIIKAGVAVHDDIKGLQRLYSFEANGFIELADEAKNQGYKNFGLRALTAIFLKQRLSKRAKISNWENHQLTTAQIHYAAADAYVGLQIFHKMMC